VLKTVWRSSATAKEFSGIGIRGRLSWARAIIPLLGLVQEKERNASEKPKITPIKTRLKIKKLLDDKRCVRLIISP
jgi:hypothetical protein